MSLTACKVSVWIGGYLVCFYVDFCALYSGVFFLFYFLGRAGGVRLHICYRQHENTHRRKLNNSMER